MSEETLKTISLCSFFVFLFGALGFLVAIILNALLFYVNAHSVELYELWVTTQILSITHIPYYLSTAVLFAGLGLLLVYRWKHTTSN